MEITETFTAVNRDDWRQWLAANHQVKPAIWLIYAKKNSQQASLSYDEAVEEALCFGWIDGVRKSLDQERFAQRFSPRKEGSSWSALNKQRVARLIQDGRMTAAGLAKIDFPLENLEEEIARTRQKEQTIPDPIREVLEKNPPAWENFSALAPSYQRQYISFITSAKREETLQRRLKEAIELLKANKKLEMR